MPKYKSIVAGSFIADISLAEGGYNYYGRIRTNGEWVIIREKTDGTEYRVAVGADAYSTNWSGRTGLTYKIATIG